MRHNRGFTLMELLVVIMIIIILAGVSMPMMRGSLARARGTEAIAALGAIRTQMELIRAEHSTAASRAYTHNPPGVTTGDVIRVAAGGVPGFDAGDLTGRYFDDNDYTIVVAAETYTITATGGHDPDTATAPNHADVVGVVVTINQAGNIVETY